MSMTLGQIQRELTNDDNRTRIREICQPPLVAWQTLAMMVVCFAVFFSSVAASVAGLIPLWVGALINGLIGYLIFSVVHDAIHRAVSRHQGLNDVIGQIALIPFAPMVTLGLFRWGHIQHHQHASGPKDPDRWCFEGPRWLLPVRWMFIDAWYFYFVLRHGDKTAYRHLRPTLVAIAICTSLFATIIAAGYGLELLFLWFLPGRMTQVLLGFAFFWLPHEPHDTPQAENFTRATTVRQGFETLMTPLLQSQNYHLIHHLFPRVPFYRYDEMWVLLEPQLREHDLAIQHDFAIKPVIHPGTSTG